MTALFAPCDSLVILDGAVGHEFCEHVGGGDGTDFVDKRCEEWVGDGHIRHAGIAGTVGKAVIHVVYLLLE